ncbi:MAG: hypothetical protein WCK09_16630 [Bacteroidota bacterium]
MESIIRRLENVYETKLRGIHEKMASYNEEHERKLDGPFLMSSREELYRKAKVKILFVGQESYRLEGRNKSESYDIIPLMENNIFVIEEDYTNSPFWHSVFSLNEILNPDFNDQCCFFWTNVSKYSVNGGPLTHDEHKFVVEQTHNLLLDEINLINPDVVVFFSGPYYDDKIRCQFNGQLQFEKVKEEIPINEFARVVHPSLPKNSFRTYHPSGGQRKHINYIQLIALYALGRDVEGLMQVFKNQNEEIKKELNLELYCDPNLGQVDSCLYFYKQEWPFGIGFCFDNTWARHFFGGICRKELKAIPGKTAKLIQDKLGTCEPPTEGLPYWFWFDEHKDWNQRTFDEIRSGELKKKIKIKVEEMLLKLEGEKW